MKPETVTLIVTSVVLLLWIVFYPNPFYRKGRFRRPGWWDGSWK